MGNARYFDNLIEGKLLDLHTAFIGRVVSFSGKTATVQPLGGVKEVGRSAQKKAVLSNIPVVQSARNKVKSKSITYVYDVTNHEGRTRTEQVACLEPLEAGDLVLCVCCERDISGARRGQDDTPAIGRHSMSDAVVVGVIS